ncbi:T-complex protein 1 subunit gamma-like protein [Cricetulus griseus]|uniref:T-complex protein 1 subunit gamma-like protein n=1 Tax=Cricetulus griseus TaxID=10029 RepID=A0A061IEV2_CRIGR|nr:T-complex protein 1 subunit gamma-like protein [Cricetulus griseus]
MNLEEKFNLELYDEDAFGSNGRHCRINDGIAIIQVQHPVAKSMIETSRIQDEDFGDETTSVIILAKEMLSVAEHFLEQQMHHPTVVISALPHGTG